MGLNRHATLLFFVTPVLANKMQLFIHCSTPYIHPRLDSRIGLRFSDWINICQPYGSHFGI